MVLSRPVFDLLITAQTTYAAALAADQITIDGDHERFDALFALMDDYAPPFPIVTP